MTRPARFPLVLLLVLLLPALVSAQKEFENWAFGWGAGLRFQADGSISQFVSSTYSREGVSAMSDPKTGDLLFYTDGVTVWDRTHSPMPNGQGLFGNYSSTQSGVIVPIPDSETRYYVFTAGHPSTTTLGYRYSIVDMAANGGLGDVESATKNTLLLTNGTEKITVARHCNNEDFWLVLREAGSNRFHVYPINAAGIQSPSSFSLGATLQGGWNNVGHLEFSSDQKMLAHAIGPEVQGGTSIVEVLRFDNATGVLSGPFITIPGFGFAYGVEFSADNKLLYVSNLIGGPSQVLQYNLSLNTNQAIINSKTSLTSTTAYNIGALQIAPDGKIYIAKEYGYDNGWNYLDVIESPSVPGTGCGYKVDGLQLSTGRALIGLPNFPNYLLVKVPAVTAKKNCTTGAFDFKVVNTESGVSANWDFGDPNSGSANMTQALQPSHTFSDTGLFLVKAIFQSPCGADTSTLLLKIDGYRPIPDTSFCKGQQVTLVGPSPTTKWNGATTGGSFQVNQPGAVQYQFSDAFGCLVTKFVQVEELPSFTTTEQILICGGDTAWVSGQPVTASGNFSTTFNAANGCDSTHIVQVIAGEDTVFIPEPYTRCIGDTLSVHGATLTTAGNYIFEEPSLAGCVLLYQVELKLVPPPDFSLATTPGGCNGKPIGSILLQNPEPGWQARLGSGNWSGNMDFEKLPAGRYALSVRNAQGCESSDTVQVSEAPPFLLKIRLDTAFAECGVMTATASHTSQWPVRYQWSPSQGLACADCPMVELQPEQGQVFQLLAVDSAGCRAVAQVAAPGGEIYHIYAPNVFSPNDDGENDRFTLYGSRCARLIRQFGIYDRWGSLVFYRENLTLGDEPQGWDGYARSRLATPGVFTWWAEVELHSGRRIKLKGSVTVVL